MTSQQIAKGNALIQPRMGGAPLYPNAYIYTEGGATVTEGTGAEANTKFSTVEAADVDTSNFYQPRLNSAVSASGYRKRG
jgi:hypothetical protein